MSVTAISQHQSLLNGGTLVPSCLENPGRDGPFVITIFAQIIHLDNNYER
jgi:hypothetical protein